MRTEHSQCSVSSTHFSQRKLDLIKNGKSLNEIWTKLTEPHPTCSAHILFWSAIGDRLVGWIVPAFDFAFDSLNILYYQVCGCKRTYIDHQLEPGHTVHNTAYLKIFYTWNTLFQLFLFRFGRWTVHVHRMSSCFNTWMILILLSLDLAVLFFVFKSFVFAFFLLLFHINSILSHRSITLCALFFIHFTSSFCTRRASVDLLTA